MCAGRRSAAGSKSPVGKSRQNNMSAVKANQIEMPALFRPFQLGMLYDRRYDRLVPGVKLWEEEDMERDVEVYPFASSHCDTILADTLESKTWTLGIEGDLKASVLAGLVKTSDGAARYLHDRRWYGSASRVMVHFLTTVCTKQLTLSHLEVHNVRHRNVFKDGTATHVVTGIEYGANAIFYSDASYRKGDRERNQRLVALEMRNALLRRRQYNLKRSIDNDVHWWGCYLDYDVRLTEYKIAGKHKCHRESVTRNLLKELSKTALPQRVHLFPLHLLNGSAARMVREIDQTHANGLQRILQILIDCIWVATGLWEASDYLPKCQSDIGRYKRMLGRLRAEFRKQVRDVLPRIRSGETDEAELAEIIKRQRWVDLSKRWLKARRKEERILSRLDIFVRTWVQYVPLILHPRYPGNMDSFVAYNWGEYVLCYMLQVESEDEPFLDHLSELSLGRNVKTAAAEITWAAGQTWSESDKIKARLRSEVRKGEIRGADIVLFRRADGRRRTFIPPSEPGTPSEVSVTHESVVLKWAIPEDGCENVDGYEISFRRGGDKKWQEEATRRVTGVVHAIQELEPDRCYVFRVRAWCLIGKSQWSDESEPIKTGPPLLLFEEPQ